MNLNRYHLRVTKTFYVVAETEDLATDQAREAERLEPIDDEIEVLNCEDNYQPDHDE